MPMMLTAVVLVFMAAALVNFKMSTNGVCGPALASAAAVERPYLPPLLTMQNGTAVTTAEQWAKQRRPEVQGLLESTLLGAWPAERPRLVASRIINTTSTGNLNAQSSFFKLTFVTADNATELSFEIEVLSPTSTPGKDDDSRPPLFLTQWNHREWALNGCARGYVSVVYPGADTRDAAPDFQRAHPKATMMLIMARALVASCVLDFFFSPLDGSLRAAPPAVNTSQICITGHSRNGKQSLIAAAFDERFTAVIGSSPGAPVASPYHMSSHNFYGEGPDAGNAGLWWLNSTASFASHPQDLAMDGHGIVASIAPRVCAIANGWTDHEGDISFADEYNVLFSLGVYELYNKTSNLHILHRPGDHHGFILVDHYFDFFDVKFGRLAGPSFALSWAGDSSQQGSLFTKNRFLTPAGFSWDAGNNAFGNLTPPSPSPHDSSLEERVHWLLGGSPPTVRSVGTTYAEDGKPNTRLSYPSVMMAVDFEKWKMSVVVERQPVSFGDYVTGNMYWKKAASARGPIGCVIWLHPYSYATGYYGSYVLGSPITALVEAGFSVLSYDQVGFGSRVRSGGTNFYARYGGKSSLFAHMVRDARSAVDFVMCLTSKGRSTPSKCGTGEAHGGAYPNFLGRIPDIDPNKIVLAGYSLGGNVALHAAALDERIKAVASFAGFTPMRSDSNDRHTLGLRRLYDFHALIPRLGFFRDDPSKVPYDYDDLLGAIRPRPALLYTPKMDRDATFADVLSCIKKSRWDSLNHTAPDTYTNMGTTENVALASWVSAAL